MEKLNPTFINPRYDSGGFAGIPARIQNTFASDNYDIVVLFFVHAFGWRFFEKFRDESFFKRLTKDGKIEKLTLQFPSTKAASTVDDH